MTVSKSFDWQHVTAGRMGPEGRMDKPEIDRGDLRTYCSMLCHSMIVWSAWASERKTCMVWSSRTAHLLGLLCFMALSVRRS